VKGPYVALLAFNIFQGIVDAATNLPNFKFLYILVMFYYFIALKMMASTI
jgi:hypothetical protein